jgi:hypothetical protein
MAAAAWRLYAKAKQYIGDGTITLGTGGFKMALFSGSSNASTITFSTFGFNYQQGSSQWRCVH